LDPKEVEKKFAQWTEETKPTGSVECFFLDLSILDSVRKFAEEVKSLQTPVRILINNGE
jgi:short-subunit dehydrogenase